MRVGLPLPPSAAAHLVVRDISFSRQKSWEGEEAKERGRRAEKEKKEAGAEQKLENHYLLLLGETE